mmetsp:Transcript_13013/g.36598  ORF Transcript_13013/g.36598 Transcript_13013/m.36598 type:complete len:206 (-) Transcript_13013:211-828(-)
MASQSAFCFATDSMMTGYCSSCSSLSVQCKGVSSSCGRLETYPARREAEPCLSSLISSRAILNHHGLLFHISGSQSSGKGHGMRGTTRSAASVGRLTRVSSTSTACTAFIPRRSPNLASSSSGEWMPRSSAQLMLPAPLPLPSLEGLSAAALSRNTGRERHSAEGCRGLAGACHTTLPCAVVRWPVAGNGNATSPSDRQNVGRIL